jgi:hypothetical protein
MCSEAPSAGADSTRPGTVSVTSTTGRAFHRRSFRSCLRHCQWANRWRFVVNFWPNWSRW